MKIPFNLSIPQGKWRWIIGISGVLVIAALVRLFSGSVERVTEDVQRGPLSQEVSVTGSVESKTTVDLRFASTGNVNEILVQTGQEVKKGDRLMSLELDKLEAEVSRALAGIAIEDAELDLMLAGPSQEEVVLSEAKIEEAQINLDNAKSSYDNVLLTNAESIRQAELEVTKAQDTYDTAVASQSNTGNQVASDLETAYENSQAPAEDALDLLLNVLKDVDLLLAIDDDYLDTRFETEIRDSPLSLRQDTVSAYKNVRDTHAELEEQAADLFADWSGDDLELFLDALEANVENAKQMVDWALEILDNMDTSDTLDTSLQANIDTLTDLLQSDQAALSADLNTLQASISAIRDAEIGNTGSSLDADSAVTSAAANLEIAESQLQTAEVQATVSESDARMNIDVMQSRLDQRQAEHAELVAAPREVDIASQRARLLQAQASYERATAELNDAVLFAPADGIVAKVHVDPGQSLSNADVAVTFITDQLQVTANISETEVALVSLGDSVKMTLDAFDIDQVFTGSVVALDPAETVIQGVVYYQATVLFEENYEGIRPGMTVNLDILTEEKESTLFVSSQALQFENGETFVYVIEGEDRVRRTVETGIQSDRFVEILSGLKEGEKVLLYEQ